MIGSIIDGGPAKCARCLDASVIKQGRQWLCPRHYRFGQMRANAKRYGKLTPSHEWLEENIPADMICRRCSRQMNWRQKDGAATVVCLQHNRDGTMEIICLSCNTRHGQMRGDEFYDLPPDSKRCPGCGQVKLLSAFCTDRAGKWKSKKSNCRSCSKSAHDAWVKANRIKYNETRRAYYHARKASGNPIPRSR